MPNATTRSPKELEQFRRITNWAWGVWRANQSTSTLGQALYPSEMANQQQDSKMQEENSNEVEVHVAQRLGEAVNQEQASIEGVGGELQVAEQGPLEMEVQAEVLEELGPQVAEQVPAGVGNQDQGANDTGAILPSTEQLPTGVDNHDQSESATVIPFQKMFAGHIVHNEGPFVAEEYKHALEVGWQGEETRHFLDRLAQQVALDGKIALLETPAWPLILFTSATDAEWALASQPGGRCPGVLAGGVKDGVRWRPWLHHPGLPYPQLLEFVAVEALLRRENDGPDRTTPRKVYEECSLYGEIGHIKWMKAPIDDRTSDQKDEDEDEEAELGLNPRQLTQFKVFYRQMAGFSSASHAAKLPKRALPAVFRRHFKATSSAKWNQARAITEKPHPPAPDVPALAATKARRPRKRLLESSTRVYEPPETYDGVINYTNVEYVPYDWLSLLDEENDEVLAAKQAVMERDAAAALARPRKRRVEEENGQGEGSSKRTRS